MVNETGSRALRVIEPGSVTEDVSEEGDLILVGMDRLPTGFSRLRIEALRSECTRRELYTDGTKEELKGRIMAHAQVAAGGKEPIEAEEESDDLLEKDLEDTEKIGKYSLEYLKLKTRQAELEAVEDEKKLRRQMERAELQRRLEA